MGRSSRRGEVVWKADFGAALPSSGTSTVILALQSVVIPRRMPIKAVVVVHHGSLVVVVIVSSASYSTGGAEDLPVLAIEALVLSRSPAGHASSITRDARLGYTIGTPAPRSKTCSTELEPIAASPTFAAEVVTEAQPRVATWATVFKSQRSAR